MSGKAHPPELKKYAVCSNVWLCFVQVSLLGDASFERMYYLTVIVGKNFGLSESTYQLWLGPLVCGVLQLIAYGVALRLSSHWLRYMEKRIQCKYWLVPPFLSDPSSKLDWSLFESNFFFIFGRFWMYCSVKMSDIILKVHSNDDRWTGSISALFLFWLKRIVLPRSEGERSKNNHRHPARIRPVHESRHRWGVRRSISQRTTSDRHGGK